MLSIEIISKKGVLFVRLSGILTRKTANIFEDEVISFIQKIGIKYIVINLYDLQKIDKVGIKKLEKCHDICQSNKGKSLVCLKENQKFLKAEKFSTVYDELSALKLINY